MQPEESDMRGGLFRFLVCLALIGAAPLNLSAARNGVAHHKTKHHSIHLHWHGPIHSRDRIAGYIIYRSMDRGITFQKLNLSPIRRWNYDDNTVQSGMTYLYQVKSVDAKGVESEPSNQITLKVP